MTHQTIDATIEPVQDPSKRYRCRHIFIDGHRCGSPSLRGEHLCYYHHTTRGFADERRHRRTWTEFELPPLEDRSSVLAAITEVLQRIAGGNIPSKEAGLLLYGLQIASNNLPSTDEVKAKSKSGFDPQPVEQVMINPHYGDLAPVAEMSGDANTEQIPEQPTEQQGAPRSAFEDMGEAPLASHPTATEPNTLPNLNAAADSAPFTPVILSEASHSFIARGAVEGPAVALASSNTPKSTSSRPERSAVERPPYSPVSTAHPPTPGTNSHPAKPEINIPNQAPSGSTWYPNNCHAYEKRTSRPPHSAHRHQAAQRRRSRRRHELHGLQLA